MRLVLVLVFLLASTPFFSAPCGAQAVARKAPGVSREQERSKVNENVIVLMSGALGSSHLQLADDIAVVVNDGDKLRVVPAVGGGDAANIKDVLLMRGVDLGITTLHVLNALKASGELGPNIDKQIAYIAALPVETLHALAGPGVHSIQDLSGRKVSFDLKGSGTALFGPRTLKALGVSIAETDVRTHMALGDALEALRNGDLAAAFNSGPVPIPAYAGLKPHSGLKLLEVPHVPTLGQEYLPASLTSDDYPHLVAKGSRLQTIAASAVLITFNWSPGSERYRRMEKFVNAFFANIEKLKQPPRHPAWQNVNLAATVGGWQRFQPAQDWLDQNAAATASIAEAGIDMAHARAQAKRAAPGDPAEQERLIKAFIEWARQKMQLATAAKAAGLDYALIRAQARRAAPDNPAEQERLVRGYVEWVRQKQR